MSRSFTRYPPPERAPGASIQLRVMVMGDKSSGIALIATGDLGGSNNGTGITAAYSGGKGEGDNAMIKSMSTNDVNQKTRKDKPIKETIAKTKIKNKGTTFNAAVATNTQDVTNITGALSVGVGNNMKSDVSVLSAAKINPPTMIAFSNVWIES